MKSYEFLTENEALRLIVEMFYESDTEDRQEEMVNGINQNYDVSDPQVAMLLQLAIERIIDNGEEPHVWGFSEEQETTLSAWASSEGLHEATRS